MAAPLCAVCAVCNLPLGNTGLRFGTKRLVHPKCVTCSDCYQPMSDQSPYGSNTTRSNPANTVFTHDGCIQCFKCGLLRERSKVSWYYDNGAWRHSHCKGTVTCLKCEQKIWHSEAIRVGTAYICKQCSPLRCYVCKNQIYIDRRNANRKIVATLDGNTLHKSCVPFLQNASCCVICNGILVSPTKHETTCGLTVCKPCLNTVQPKIPVPLRLMIEDKDSPLWQGPTCYGCNSNCYNFPSYYKHGEFNFCPLCEKKYFSAMCTACPNRVTELMIFFRVPWSPLTHCRFPLEIRRLVETMFLLHRSRNSRLSTLLTDVLNMIVAFVVTPNGHPMLAGIDTAKACTKNNCAINSVCPLCARVSEWHSKRSCHYGCFEFSHQCGTCLALIPHGVKDRCTPDMCTKAIGTCSGCGELIPYDHVPGSCTMEQCAKWLPYNCRFCASTMPVVPSQGYCSEYRCKLKEKCKKCQSELAYADDQTIGLCTQTYCRGV